MPEIRACTIIENRIGWFIIKLSLSTAQGTRLSFFPASLGERGIRALDCGRLLDGDASAVVTALTAHGVIEMP